MKTTSCQSIFLVLLGLISLSSSGVCQEMSMMSSEQVDFFENKIRPVLVKHCYECHSQDGEKIKGGLLLDTREAARRGGDSGPAVVPGDLHESLLITAISYQDSSLEMPPKYKLDDDVIADFKKWITNGAVDPREPKEAKAAQEYSNTIDIEKGREHWAYQVPVRTDLPQPDLAASWAKNGIDHYIAERLEKEGMTPAGDADARTLLRRLFFDLIGLPPTPQQSEIFIKAHAADADLAIRETVDRLLDSERFGERWGRHWMDVARYAESTGKETNALLPHAWRYRDYVIDSFNKDKPFDQFITEQIAGDLLPYDSEDEQVEQTVATGFLALGTKGLNERNSRQFRFDLVDEQIDTTTRAFLGTTAACARCHDHKFDPIPMSDYYSLAGIFLSSNTHYGTARAIQNAQPSQLIELPSHLKKGGPDRSLADAIDFEFAKNNLQEQIREQTQEANQAQREGDRDTALRLRQGLIGLNSRLGILQGNLDLHEQDGKRKALAMGMSDREEPFDSQILIRGEEDNATTERAPRGFLQVVKTYDEQPIPESESGRLQLAHWITSPENPLTARVFANRAWLWMFGEGLVNTVDNFGSTGEMPSHPELLDHLAIRVHEMKWSVKDLIREIANSRSYRMASDFRKDYFEKDPENRLLWRSNKRRLDAESLRDAALAVGGNLDFNRPDGSLVSEAGVGFAGRTVAATQINREINNRSVYLPIVRDLLPDSLSLFDFADPSLMAGKRDVTTVPSQALYLMNSSFIQNAAESMARYLTQEKKFKGRELGIQAFYHAYSRPPSEEEASETSRYFQNFVKALRETGATQQEAGYGALVSFCQALMSSAEFRYIN